MKQSQMPPCSCCALITYSLTSHQYIFFTSTIKLTALLQKTDLLCYAIAMAL